MNKIKPLSLDSIGWLAWIDINAKLDCPAYNEEYIPPNLIYNQQF